MDLKKHNLKSRGIDEIHKFGGKFYKKIAELNGGFPEWFDEAYEGYQHNPQNPEEKRPHFTSFWPLPLKSGAFFYGSSLGHTHPNANFQTQEIYEFLDDGAMVLGFNDRVEMHLCKKNDKLSIPPGCIMTIMSLCPHLFSTLDIANPKENESTKDILLENEKGPMIALYHTGKNLFNCDEDVFFLARFGRKIKFPDGGVVKLRLNKDYEVFGIKEDVEIELRTNSKHDLRDKILALSEELRKYNISVVRARDNIECIGRDGKPFVVSGSLDALAEEPSKPLHKLLGMIRQE